MEKKKLRASAEQVHLRPWDEVIGTLNGIQATDTDVTILMTCTTEKHFAIATGFLDSEIQQQLKKLLGKKIAILKTDNPQKPFIIKPETTDALSLTLWQLSFRHVFFEVD